MTGRPERNLTDANAQAFMLSGGSHAILLVHGFTGTPGHMRPLGEALHHRGYSVQAITLPGHGSRLEDMRGYQPEDYIRCVSETAAKLQERYMRVTVAGLSMGGLLALITAAHMDIDSVVALSAPLRTVNKLLPFAGMIAPLLPVIHWKPRDETETSLQASYDYGYPGFPARAGRSLHRLILLTRNILGKINCPVLAVQSRADHTVSADSMNMIMSNINSAKKTSCWLTDAPHVITLSEELDTLVCAMLAFLAA
jgi:carboxylesterase